MTILHLLGRRHGIGDPRPVATPGISDIRATGSAVVRSRIPFRARPHNAV
jgi:hypothetical protein